MKKLNQAVYQKLIIQAKEAKEQGLNKLASSINNAVGPMFEDEQVNYDYNRLRDEVYSEMWKIATHVIKYYDLHSADAGKLDETLETLADKFIQDLEQTLGVDEKVVGPLETLLPGESK